MATIGVIAYNSPTTLLPMNNGLKITNRKFVNAMKSNNNKIVAVKKINNIKPMATKMVMMKKKSNAALPLSETSSNILIGIGANPMSPSKALSKPLQSLMHTAASPTGKGAPMPIAVARRNARERNRVKQVNNGFAALRDRIPEEVAEAFEAQGNGRGSSKKLSKVETLRMAVAYIRSLERVLMDSNGPETSANDSMAMSVASYQPSDSSSVISDLTPPSSDNISSGSFDEMDLLPDVTTIDGVQYIRIPGTNTYQSFENAITDESSILYTNDENMDPMFDEAAPGFTIIHSPGSECFGAMVEPALGIGYSQGFVQQQ